MDDTYSCFKCLAEHHTEGVDFRICVTDRVSPVAIIAPHGGRIEHGTSDISASIAGKQFSLYCFEGIMPPRKNGILHITSTNFDEPQGLQLVKASTIVIAVHGRKDTCNNKKDARTIWLGGRDKQLRTEIGEALQRVSFEVTTNLCMPGIELNNICNRGQTGAGVQLELPSSRRKELVRDRSLLQTFAAAVQEAIERHVPVPG